MFRRRETGLGRGTSFIDDLNLNSLFFLSFFYEFLSVDSNVCFESMLEICDFQSRDASRSIRCEISRVIESRDLCIHFFEEIFLPFSTSISNDQGLCTCEENQC